MDQWKVIKKPVVGLSNFDGGTGTFAAGARGITVNPRSSTGRYYFNSVMQDLRAIDFGNSADTRISFKGYSQTNWDKVGGENYLKVKLC